MTTVAGVPPKKRVGDPSLQRGGHQGQNARLGVLPFPGPWVFEPRRDLFQVFFFFLDLVLRCGYLW